MSSLLVLELEKQLLHQTLIFLNFLRLKQREEEEAERYKTDMGKKMDMLLKLKNEITHNRVCRLDKGTISSFTRGKSKLFDIHRNMSKNINNI